MYNEYNNINYIQDPEDFLDLGDNHSYSHNSQMDDSREVLQRNDNLLQPSQLFSYKKESKEVRIGHSEEIREQVNNGEFSTIIPKNLQETLMLKKVATNQLLMKEAKYKKNKKKNKKDSSQEDDYSGQPQYRNKKHKSSKNASRRQGFGRRGRTKIASAVSSIAVKLQNIEKEPAEVAVKIQYKEKDRKTAIKYDNESNCSFQIWVDHEQNHQDYDSENASICSQSVIQRHEHITSLKIMQLINDSSDNIVQRIMFLAPAYYTSK